MKGFTLVTAFSLKKTDTSSRHKNGFTLVELLVVIAIISILSSLGLMSYLQAQRSARDTQRKSDIKQYQAGLEAYANNSGGLYLIKSSTATDMCDDPNSLLALQIMAACPNNVGTDDTFRYHYLSADGLQYYLQFRMESKSSTWFVACSNGRTGTMATAPAGANCPLP